MHEINVVATNIIRKANFEIGDYYATLWGLLRNSLGYSFNEDDYYHIRKEDSTDIEFHWTCESVRDSYVTFRIWVESKLRSLKEVRVKVGNEVRKMHSGEIELNIKGVLLLDTQDFWRNHWLFKHFPTWRGMNLAQFFYEKVLYKQTIDNYWKRVYDHVFILQNEMKSYFELPRW